jgi:2-dehydropantoate 2-reductase
MKTISTFGGIVLMRICIVGAGSIGCYLGAKLALSGEDVTLIARGKQLEAIRENGIVVQWDEGSFEIALPALTTSKIREAGLQDLIILAVKAQDIPGIADDLKTLIGPETMIISGQNGLPWWYFQNYEGKYKNLVLEFVDPNGIIQSLINPNHIIGSVLHLGAERISVGVIKPTGTKRILFGELDGSTTERIIRLNKVFTKAGFEAFISPNIRSEIWYKLWGNIAHNPISALTRSTLKEQCEYGPVRDLVKNMMLECQGIAEELGVTFETTIESRLQVTEAMGDHKTPMLQDVEAGRAVEAKTLIAERIKNKPAGSQLTSVRINSVHTDEALFDLQSIVCKACLSCN